MREQQVLKEALKKTGISLTKRQTSALLDVLGEVFGVEDEEALYPDDLEGGTILELDLPDSFFVEIPVVLAAELDERGRIVVDTGEGDLKEELKESLNSWQEGDLNIFAWEDEDAEEPLRIDPGAKGKKGFVLE